MKPLLYGIPLSLFVRKVRFVLEYKGIDYDLDPVIPAKPPEGFKNISPIGKIPALKLGDFTISDSSVICQYLEKKFPENSLLPENAEDFAKSLWFDEYSDTKMTESITGIFFEKFGRPRIFNEPPNEERIADLETKVPAILEYLNKELEGKEFLLGSSVSFADVSVFCNLYNHVTCGYAIDPLKYANLNSYYERVFNQPFIENVIKKEREEVPLS